MSAAPDPRATSSLRTDNAAARLTPMGIAAGLVGETQALAFRRDAALRNAARARLDSATASPNMVQATGGDVRQDGVVRSAFDWLRWPGMDRLALIATWPDLSDISPVVLESLRIDSCYATYLDRQDADIATYRRDENVAIPSALDYWGLPGLSHEMAERLSAVRPSTLGAASRIPGISPTALVALLPYIGRAA